MNNQELLSEAGNPLHSLLYALAHQVLPGIVLQENNDQFQINTIVGNMLLLGEEGEGSSDEEIFHDLSVEDPETTEISEAELNELLSQTLAEPGEKADSELEILLSPIFAEEPADLLPENAADARNSEIEAEFDARLEAFSNRLFAGGSLDLFDDPDLLEISWYEAWEMSDLPELPPIQGYQLEHRSTEELNILLFSFPPPVQITGVWMAAVIQKPEGPYRYFTLEKTIGSGNREKAILGEWRLNKHYNYGTHPGTVDDKKAFVQAAVEKYLART